MRKSDKQISIIVFFIAISALYLVIFPYLVLSSSESGKFPPSQEFLWILAFKYVAISILVFSIAIAIFNSLIVIEPFLKRKWMPASIGFFLSMSITISYCLYAHENLKNPELEFAYTNVKEVIARKTVQSNKDSSAVKKIEEASKGRKQFADLLLAMSNFTNCFPYIIFTTLLFQIGSSLVAKKSEKIG